MPKGGLVSAARFQFTLLKEPREPVAFESPHIRGIQDSVASWITRCGFRIPGTGFRIFGPWNVDSGIQWVVGFRIF